MNARVCLAVSLTLALIAPAVAHADRAPNPGEVKADPPAPPPTIEPAKVEAKTETKTETRVEAKTDAKAADVKKTESAGMCRVGAPAGGWELLALLGLGLARRRRMA